MKPTFWMIYDMTEPAGLCDESEPKFGPFYTEEELKGFLDVLRGWVKRHSPHRLEDGFPYAVREYPTMVFRDHRQFLKSAGTLES